MASYETLQFFHALNNLLLLLDKKQWLKYIPTAHHFQSDLEHKIQDYPSIQLAMFRFVDNNLLFEKDTVPKFSASHLILPVYMFLYKIPIFPYELILKYVSRF